MPPRRSTRRKVTTVVSPVEVDSGSGDDDAKPVIKKKATRTRTVRGRRGSLADLPTMPLDIIFEVLSYMHPLDLLHLARTTKDFRALLMSRTSLPFWKATRHNVQGLPECPSLLSEPAFASFAFENSCLGCLKRIIIPTDCHWTTGMRLCDLCIDKLTDNDIQSEVPGSAVLVHRHFYPSKRRYMYNYGYLKSDVETFNKLWKSTNESKREELLKDRRLAITQMESNFASEMRAWFKLKKMSRSDELAEMKRNRQEAIVQRLENMGWGKELNLVRESRANTEFMAIIGAKEAKELTERGWKRMEAPLIKFFEDFRHARHLEAYRRNMYERFRTVADICPILAKPFEGIFPVPCQLALLPQVRDIVDLPTGPKLTSASFDSLKSDIASMVAAWKAAETARLIEEINSAMSMKLPLNADLGSLAIGTFHRCADYSCRNYLTYPAVLSKGYSSNTEAADSSDDYATVSHAILSGHGTRHRYEAWVYKAMQHIIEASGRSLLSTSAEEMDSLAIRLVCSTEGCKSDDHFRGVLSVYTWRSALEHARLNAGAEHRFTLAAEDLPLTKVQDLESVLSLRAAAALESAYGWKCKHCKGDRLHDDTDKKETMLKHVKAKHDIEQPGPTDIYLSPSCETLGFSMSPVHLLSRELTPKNILDLPNSIKTAVSLGTGDTRPL